MFGLFIAAERIEAQGHHGHHRTTESPCPFMPGEKTACLMTIRDHVNAWQDFLNAVPAVKILLAVFILAGISWFKVHRILQVLSRAIPSVNKSPPRFLDLFFATTIQPRAP